jgi:TP901 family phage tail tape measure protein
MPDRTVKVTLTASIAQYVAGMEKAALTTRTVGSEAAKLAGQKQGLNDLGRVLLGIGVVAAAGVALAIKSFADFDAKMAQVKTLSGATAEEMDKLSDAALHMGQAIGFTATEVADAEIELVKAGVSVKDQLGGALKGALELAAAGQIDVADATEIATVAMTQFALKGKDVPHVADLLAAGADKALGSVGDLGEALKSGGLVAAQFGVSLDETVGTLSAFANAGLIGETAGTDLRQMLLKLANPAADAAAELKTLGINIYDQSGNFIGLNALSKDLYSSLSKQSDATRNTALATIFGSRAIAGANVLYKEGAKAGQGGIADWTEKVNASGFAAKQAAGKMDNLNGDVTKLKAAFQTAFIEAGSSANDVLRELVQGLTGILSVIGEIPKPVLGAGLAIAGIVAVIGLVGGAALLAVTKFAQFKVSLETLKISADSAKLAIGGVTAALGLGLVIIGAWAQKVAEDKSNADAFKDSLDQTTGALTKYSKTLEATQLQNKGLFDAAKKAGVSQKELLDAVLKGGDAYDKVSDKILKYQTSLGLAYSGIATGYKSTSDVNESLKDVRNNVVEGTKEFKNQKAAIAEGVPVTKSAAEAYQDAAKEAQTLDDNLLSLIDTIDKANNVGQDAVNTNASYQQGLADLSDYVDKARKKVDGYSLGVDENTAAGAKNVSMLADLAKKNEDAAKAQFALDGNTTNYLATLNAGRQQIIDHAIALGATADQAQAIADKVAAIPTDKEIKILADTSQAEQAIRDLDLFLGQHQGHVITYTTSTQKATGSADGNMFDHARAFASGGFPTGVYAGGAPLYKFAEPETRWEAFISGRAGEETRNRRIWAEAGRRLGVSPAGYSIGGGGSSGATSSTEIPVNINVNGPTDLALAAAMAGNSVAIRVRGAMKGY